MYLYVITLYPSYLVVEMLKITLLFSLCGRLKLFIQWLPSHFTILPVSINMYIYFPSNTTIYRNKAMFWYLCYNKQMAVLGGKYIYLSKLKIFVFYPPVTVIACPNFSFFKKGIPTDNRYLFQPYRNAAVKYLVTITHL